VSIRSSETGQLHIGIWTTVPYRRVKASIIRIGRSHIFNTVSYTENCHFLNIKCMKMRGDHTDFRDEGIGFSLNSDHLEECIAAHSNEPYYGSQTGCSVSLRDMQPGY
jgi:hypothetical protein